MKLKVFVIITLLSTTTLKGFSQEKIHWMTLPEVEKAMEKEPRKILIDVYTKWCGPCRMMANNTFTNPEVVKYVNEHYYAVKFDAEGPEEVTFKGHTYKNPSYDPARGSGRNGTHELTMAIAPVNGRVAYPTIVYMDEKTQIISPVQGYWKPEQILPLLHFIVEEVYLTETTFDQYSAKYNATK